MVDVVWKILVIYQRGKVLRYKCHSMSKALYRYARIMREKFIIAVCIYRLVLISIKWSETAQKNALARADIIVTQLLRYHMPLLYFVCNHLIKQFPLHAVAKERIFKPMKNIVTINKTASSMKR